MSDDHASTCRCDDCRAGRPRRAVWLEKAGALALMAVLIAIMVAYALMPS